MDIPEKYKKMIPAAILIVLAIAGISYYNKIQDDKKNAKPAIITEREMNLTQEERRIAEDKLSAIQAKIENQSKGITNMEKYGWNIQAGAQELILGRFLKAKEYFLAASKLQPNDYNAWVALHDAALAMNDFDAARENIKKALTLDPSNPGIWKKYIQLEKEKFGATDQDLDQLFSQAFVATRSDLLIVTFYAQLLEEKGDIKGALEQWKKALAADPEGKEIYHSEINRLEGK
jgi:tetratricopeptide (TPR) repeat protein